MDDERVSAVRYTDDTLTVDLTDGRTISGPPRLAPAPRRGTPVERANWQTSAGGYGKHSPNLDENLSTEGLLRAGAGAEGGARFGVLALRAVGEVEQREPHPLERLAAMKAALARMEPEGGPEIIG